MNQSDTDTSSETVVDTARAATGSGRETVSKATEYVRHGLGAGAVVGATGGTTLLAGLRALRAGKRTRGVAGVAAGAALLAAAVARRRSRGGGASSDVDATDVVDTGPDVAGIADEAGGVGEGDRATGEAAAAVADTSPDIEDVGSGLDGDDDTEGDVESDAVDQRDVARTGVDSETLATAAVDDADDDGDAGGAESEGGSESERETEDESESETETEDADAAEDVDRLGQAAFDRQSREVPAPQRAFNQGYLSHSAEAFWGIRSSDDAVLVSRDYDAVAGREGVRYVASSEIGDDVRELPIPDTVLDHWDSILGGGTAVTGGDDVLFATTEDLAADRLLRVLPAEWADDAFGEEE